MKQLLYTLLVTTAIFILTGQMALAQKAGSVSLLDDLVTVEDTNFVIDKQIQCEVSLPLSLGGGAPFNDFGMRVHFTAPAKGLISRDKFIALSMRLLTEARIRLAADIPGLTNEQTLQAMKCREAPDYKEKNEYDFSVRMTAEGVQTTIINNRTGTTHVTREQWHEVVRSMPKAN
jgi:hypothetical protein